MTATDLPTTMPAAVLKGLMHVEVEDRPLPELGPDDVLLEVSHCGICGSDLHFMVEWEGAAKPNAIEGHEYSGTVAAVGSAVKGWKVGEEVVGGPSPRCGVCEYCLAGRPSLCLERGKVGAGEKVWQGAFARYKAVEAAELLRVPDGLSLRHAALVEPMAVALHGITRLGWRPSRRARISSPVADRSASSRSRRCGRGYRRHRRQRTPRGAAGAVRASRRAHRRPVGAVRPDDAARPRRRAVRRRARVLGKP